MLLVPAASEILPAEASTESRLTRNISLAIPLVSAAMDTVTESRLAIAMAREGGIGVIHRNLSITDQAAEVDRVKRSESGMITNPITVSPETSITDAMNLMAQYHVSGVPVTDEVGHLVGIVTNRDLRFVERSDEPVSSVMTASGLVTAPVGTTLEAAQVILGHHRIEKLPIVESKRHTARAHHGEGHPEADRLPAGHQGRAWPPARRRRRRHRPGRLRADGGLGGRRSGRHRRRHRPRARPQRDRHRGEDARRTSRSTSSPATSPRQRRRRALIDAGADAIKVGIGPGSICTTRVIAGIGVPQITAIFDCAAVASRRGVPVVADGGVQFSGDVAKALAAGASTVMLGNALAGVDESPGEIVMQQGERYKEYRGMGSLGAMQGRSYSKDRYFQGSVESGKLVPEGIEGTRPLQGPPRHRAAPDGRRSAPGHGLLRRPQRGGTASERPVHASLTGEPAREATHTTS